MKSFFAPIAPSREDSRQSGRLMLPLKINNRKGWETLRVINLNRLYRKLHARVGAFNFGAPESPFESERVSSVSSSLKHLEIRSRQLWVQRLESLDEVLEKHGADRVEERGISQRFFIWNVWISKYFRVFLFLQREQWLKEPKRTTWSRLSRHQAARWSNNLIKMELSGRS